MESGFPGHSVQMKQIKQKSHQKNSSPMNSNSNQSSPVSSSSSSSFHNDYLNVNPNITLPNTTQYYSQPLIFTQQQDKDFNNLNVSRLNNIQQGSLTYECHSHVQDDFIGRNQQFGINNNVLNDLQYDTTTLTKVTKEKNEQILNSQQKTKYNADDQLNKNTQRQRPKKHSNKTKQHSERRKRSKSRSRNKNKRQRRSHSPSNKHQSLPQNYFNDLNLYNFDRSIIGNMIINDFRIYPGLLGFGIPQRTNSYIFSQYK